MSEGGEILGRPFKIVEPAPSKSAKHAKRFGKPHARVHVDGLKKADGSPIRFHSVKSAKNHIRNFRLER
jgi:hypothetical protein